MTATRVGLTKNVAQRVLKTEREKRLTYTERLATGLLYSGE